MRYAGGILGGVVARASLTAGSRQRKIRRRPSGAELREPESGEHACGTSTITCFDKVDTEAAALSRIRTLVGRLLSDEPRGNRVDHAQPVHRQQALVRRRQEHRAARHFDLREIRSPIILFASMGDNITPPQQAFNWVADVYGSTEEIKARGQVIVGLHASERRPSRHLCVGQSGKEGTYADRLSAGEPSKLLPPGLYGMVDHRTERRKRRNRIRGRVSRTVASKKSRRGSTASSATTRSRSKRSRNVSEFNQRAYELFAQPIVQAMSNDDRRSCCAKFHPLRLQNWAFSRFNPWLAWLPPAAEAVQEPIASPADETIRARATEQSRRRDDQRIARLLSRAMRDADDRGNILHDLRQPVRAHAADANLRQTGAKAGPGPQSTARELAGRQAKALASIREGRLLGSDRTRGRSCSGAKASHCRCRGWSYAQGTGVRVYAELSARTCLPMQWRRIRGEQEIIVALRARTRRSPRSAALLRRRRTASALSARCSTN